jgi:hypothetical protein
MGQDGSDGKMTGHPCQASGGRKTFLRGWKTRPRRAPSEFGPPPEAELIPHSTPAKTQRISNYLLLAATVGGGGCVIPK